VRADQFVKDRQSLQYQEIPMIAISLHSRLCPLCGTRESSHLFAEANVGLEALDPFAFASRKLPEYMHWRL
jgi:hypothetical protein